MEYDVKPISELSKKEITSGNPERLGKSFLLELKKKLDKEVIGLISFIDDIMKKYTDSEVDTVERNLSEAVQWLCNKGLLAEIRHGTFNEPQFFITRLGHNFAEPGTTMIIMS